MQLSDDGTLDTVIRCSECGAELRYNFDPSDCDGNPSGGTYEDFVETAIDDATEEHNCNDNGGNDND